MILCDEECDFLIPILNKLSPKDVELVFVDDEEMKFINKKWRGIEKSTDVLSFPLENIDENLPLGSVLINKTMAEQKAKEFKHSFNDEISLLFIHAVLHLLGFDHEKDQGQMREKEEEIIKCFKLPKSLILRTQT